MSKSPIRHFESSETVFFVEESASHHFMGRRLRCRLSGPRSVFLGCRVWRDHAERSSPLQSWGSHGILVQRMLEVAPPTVGVLGCARWYWITERRGWAHALELERCGRGVGEAIEKLWCQRGGEVLKKCGEALDKSWILVGEV